MPGSGKSTWARDWVAEDTEWRLRINRDDLRLMTFGYLVLDRHREETLSTIQHAMVEAALKAHKSVVVDDTNLTARFVKDWLRLAAKLGVPVEFKDFDIDLDEAMRRVSKRNLDGGLYVPLDVVQSFYQRFTRKGRLVPPPTLESDSESVLEPYERGLFDDTAAKVYLVDIDGTLADMGPCGRGPFEWLRVGEDVPHWDVVNLVRRLHDADYHIVFMSGRDAVCRPETVAWLQQYVTHDWSPHSWELHMRPAGDMRKDSVVKYELFNKHVRYNYLIDGVIDDRNQVVEMWRALGLTVFQPRDGAF